MVHEESRPSPRNRLATATSPYLLQHAGNPVDWYPWGPEAFERARALHRPIFLSVGYAACHWCHVMERESFEDEATAADLNAWFVPVKVDREERPDVDAVYMRAVQALTGNGGWPMSVFLAPDGRPFFGGTYFPDRPRHGMPSFRQVLQSIHRAWEEQPGDLDDVAGRLTAAIGSGLAVADGAAGLPDRQVGDAAEEALATTFDGVHGGWGSAPKFPQAMTIRWLLRRHHVTGSARALQMACRTLDAMADGGIRDQLGGGFHRYSTDATWLVPHFEQMLYDNALLAKAYLEAWTATGEHRYREVVTGILDAMLRDLQTQGGGFAASLDADTDGEEGGTFTWSAAEIREVLGADAPLLCSAYGVADGGNWEGRTILARVTGDRDLAERHGCTPQEVVERLANARARLLDRRSRRRQPARDDKVLAAWNGLAIGALADAARGLEAAGGPDERVAAGRYRAAAVAAASDVIGGLLGDDGRLRRSWKDGRAVADGVLEDYADLAEGLLALHGATADERWFSTARHLADAILARFAAPGGGFFDAAADGESLVIRPREEQDGAVPSGGSTAAGVLLRLAALTGETAYRDAATAAIATVAPYLGSYPTGFANWLAALELATAGPMEVAVLGEPGDARSALVQAVDHGFRPFVVLAVAQDAQASVVPLVRGRFALGGRPTAFVCRDFACRQPVTEPEALEALLASG